MFYKLSVNPTLTSDTLKLTTLALPSEQHRKGVLWETDTCGKTTAASLAASYTFPKSSWASALTPTFCKANACCGLPLRPIS